jgi:hypothetical protein
VPIVARVARLDGVQRREHGRDAQHLGHGQLACERQLLREVPEHAGDGDGAAAGRELPGDQPEQCALPGAVRRDETRAAVADGE